MKILSKIFKFFTTLTKKDIIYGLIIILLSCFLYTAVNKCTDDRAQYENNIIALNDTIHYYQGKNGNLVATIRGFESNIKDLKLLNMNLYDQIENLKAKGNVTNATYFSGIVENPTQDTAYIVLHDTIINGFRKEFAFNNKYRILEGNVSYKEDTVGVNISKDQVLFDYTVAMDDKNNIMIHSSNPYVKFNEITGFQLPHNKEKHWSLNAFGNFGYNPSNNDKYYDLGISLDYRIKRFSIGPMIFFEHNLLTKDKSIYIGGSMNFGILEW